MAWRDTKPRGTDHIVDALVSECAGMVAKRLGLDPTPASGVAEMLANERGGDFYFFIVIGRGGVAAAPVAASNLEPAELRALLRDILAGYGPAP